MILLKIQNFQNIRSLTGDSPWAFFGFVRPNLLPDNDAKNTVLAPYTFFTMTSTVESDNQNL